MQERLLRVIVSAILFLWAGLCFAAMCAAVSVLPDNIGPHFFRYFLQIIMIILCAVFACAIVCEKVWGYIDRKND